MKRNVILKIGIVVALMSSTGVISTSCSSNGNEIENPEEEEIIDLGEKELANCYIVQEAGKYKFLADNQFNLGEGLPVPPVIYPVEAKLIWQTVNGAVKSVEISFLDEKPFVIFEVEEAKGNALIAVLDSNGEICWSWHIWMPEEEIYSVYSSTGYEVMNMNLGAITATPGNALSYGLLYQWGRKDPFPASATLTGTTTTVSAPMYDINGDPVSITNSDWFSTTNNTIAYSISHPTECISNYSQYSVTRDWLIPTETNDALWGNPEGGYRDATNNTYPNKGRKTCYDPSPAGWRVPPSDVFRDYTTSGGYAWDYSDFNITDINNDNVLNNGDYNYGWHFNVNDKVILYFPAAARFDGSYAMLMGSMAGLWGNYWSNSPYPSIAGGGFCALSFQVKDQSGNDIVTVSPSGGGSRADAYSIRCIRDKN